MHKKIINYHINHHINRCIFFRSIPYKNSILPLQWINNFQNDTNISKKLFNNFLILYKLYCYNFFLFLLFSLKLNWFGTMCNQ